MTNSIMERGPGTGLRGLTCSHARWPGVVLDLFISFTSGKVPQGPEKLFRKKKKKNVDKKKKGKKSNRRGKRVGTKERKREGEKKWQNSGV